MRIKISDNAISSITKKLAEGAPDHIRAGYLTGCIDGDDVLIQDVLVPEQQSNKVWSKIVPESANEILRLAAIAGKRVVGFAQYNAGFPTYECGATVLSRHQVSQYTGMPSIGIVINSKGDYSIFE